MQSLVDYRSANRSLRIQSSVFTILVDQIWHNGTAEKVQVLSADGYIIAQIIYLYMSPCKCLNSVHLERINYEPLWQFEIAIHEERQCFLRIQLQQKCFACLAYYSLPTVVFIITQSQFCLETT